VRDRCWGAAEADKETRMDAIDGILVATIQCIQRFTWFKSCFFAPKCGD
jgi:hypothetical protein